MNQQSRDVRREANQAFLESLQTLGADIQPTYASPPHPRRERERPAPPLPERGRSLGFNPSDLEQAIADIEQYLQQQDG